MSRRARLSRVGMVLVGWLATTASFADAPFSSEQLVTTLSGVGNVEAGTLDAVDGLDLFYAAEGSQIVGVALQGGGGTWTTQGLTPGSRIRGLDLADIDGDGDDDLIYTDFNADRVYWRANDLDTSGTFLARQELASIGRAQGIFAVDMDGDDDIDVVVAGRTADAYYWIENTAGDGSDWFRHTIATGVNAAQVVVAADFDGDGDLDVAGGSSSGSGRLIWYENVNGDALTWLGRTIYSSRIGAVAAGDLDLDGDQDILVQDIVADDILWWENTAGDGSAWTSTMISSFPTSRKGLQAVDLDFDGDLDVVGDPNGDWWENIDKATSWTRRSYSNATDVTDTDVADVDGDGDLDIVAARNTSGRVSWWANETCAPGDDDDDADGVRNGCDVCDGFDDRLDADEDLVPDGCDACPGFDDRVDVDGDMVPDGCASAASIAIDNVTLAEGDGGTTAFTFTVTLSGSVAGGFTVPYATVDGTATAGGFDYTAASGSLSFAGTDGEQQTLTVSILGDARVEGDESFTVELGAPSSASVTVDDGSGLGTLFNDDAANLSIDDPATVEGDAGSSALVFTVTSTGAVDGGFSVDFYSNDQTATGADGDYVPQNGTIHFVGADGEQQTVTMQVNGDTKLEADEQFRVHLRNPSRPGVLIPDGTGFGRIQNDDSASLAIADVSQAETDAGSTIFQFAVTLAGAVQDGFTVPFATVDGTATMTGGDYTPSSGTLTFAGSNGEVQTVDVSVLGDVLLETDETFTVGLGAPSKGGISVGPPATGTVENDDSASIALGDVSQLEGDAGTTLTFTVSLTGGVAGGFTVPFATADGTATVADGDYTASSGTLTFAGTPGETQTVSVSVAGDETVELDESFALNLGSPSVAGVLVTDSSGLATLQNDDGASLAIDDVTQAEGDGGAQTFRFIVQLSHAVAGGLTLPFAVADGTATVADGDFAAASGTLTFSGAAGETQVIDVTVSGDPVLEDDETFTVDLGTPAPSSVSVADLTVTDGSGLGTVLNDDAASISIADVTQAESDGGAVFQFTVALTGAVEAPFTVGWSTLNGTADGTDFTADSGTLSFTGNDGETQAVDVTVLGDAVVEADESFFVQLGLPSDGRVSVADGTGLGTIQNDDTAALSIDNVSSAESDAGTTFPFTVRLSGEVDGGFTVTYATVAGTASASSDFVPTASILSFAGSDGKSHGVDVSILGDTVVEADETFTVYLGVPSVGAVTIVAGGGVGTLVNDDSAALSIADVSLVEDAASALQFQVLLTGDVAGGFTVPFSSADGTAVAGSDYTAAAGSLSFSGSDGEIQTVSVPVIGDAVVEGDETFSVDLGVPSRAAVTLADGTALGTLLNDDSASISIDDVSELETDGDTVFRFTVSLSGEVAAGFTVPVSTVDGTASASGGDYGAMAANLSFAGSDGEVQTVDVTVHGDPVVEGDETFTVELGAPSSPSVLVSDGYGIGTLLNDDDGAWLVAELVVEHFESPFDTVTYGLTLANVGAGDQADDPGSHELENVLPTSLRVLGAMSDTPGFRITVDGAGNAVYGNGALAPGQVVQVLIEAVVVAEPGTEIANQAQVRFDSDHDGINDTVNLSDDPSTPGLDDATVLLGMSVLDVPTLGELGLGLMMLLLSAAALRVLRRAL